MRVAIIGAGAAGCFCAIELKRRHPEADVHVYEAGTKALAKVAVTGGGRCNLTNTFRLVDDLRKVYPRGDKLMRRALTVFSQDDCWEWFEREGVRLVAQDDECVFPVSQNAMEIVNTLQRLMRQLGVGLHLRHRVEDVIPTDAGGYIIHFKDSAEEENAERVIITTGGHPKASGFDMLRHLDVRIEAPLPSLFTFNISGDWKEELMGTVVSDAAVTLCGTRFRSCGALLLTHWGMSGPAILRLSSYGARHLAEHDYRGMISVNWYGDDDDVASEEAVRTSLNALFAPNAQKFVTSVYPSQFTARHWQVLLQRAGIPLTQRIGALNQKHLNRLVTTLTADTYELTGRCHFKEEFVTCGGVSLKSISPKTLESRAHPGLYFAGEVLDVDGVTGGFNLQAAWSMAMVIASNDWGAE